jgi:hypothetical protein
VHHRILHRHLQACSLTGDLALVERAQQGNCHQHSGAGVAKRWPRVDRRTAGLASHADRLASRLCDHVESEPVLIRLPSPKPLTWQQMIPGLSSGTTS